jgi:hypothetical protein
MAALIDSWLRGFWRLHWAGRRGLRWANQSNALLSALVLGGVALNVAVWGWADRQQSQWANELAAMDTAQANRARVKTAVGNAAPAAWAHFEAVLVPSDGMPSVLHDVLNLAEDQQVDVLSGEYAIQADHEGGFVRHQLTMPVRGRALAVRQFIEDALATHRGLALLGLEIKRGQMAQGQVEASIQWALLARPQPGSERAK